MKKRVIFTLYDELQKDQKISHQDQARNNMVRDYFATILKNKKDYADSIGVDFVFYENSMIDKVVGRESDFTNINLYKHRLMDKLADEYEEIMYVDMDVIFNTDLNIFDEHDLSKGIYVKDMNYDVADKDKASLLYAELGSRSSTLKYHITKDLLDGKDNNVINTGIILGRHDHIKTLCFEERMIDAVNKINEIKDVKSNLFEQQYYANNESIFSYILEKYDVPYVLMEEQWHNIFDETAKDITGHCLHFINKQFNAFYKTKTQCVFSIHIEIPDDNLDNPSNYPDLEIPKSLMVKRQLIKYQNRLLENHKEYSKNIGAEYLHFGRDEKYENFKSRFPDLSEYDVINLYKIYLLDELTKEYDYVLYVDFDVYFRQQHNIFDFLVPDYTLHCKHTYKPDILIPSRNIDIYFKTFQYDFRNPQTKYWNTYAMLLESGYPKGDNEVFNTGIVCASRYTMDKLDYFSDIEDTIALMKSIKEDDSSMYHENLRSRFGYDNESIFSYKVKMNDVPFKDMSDSWHYISDLDSAQALIPETKERRTAKYKYDMECKKHDVQITHFISKNFGLEFDT